MPATGYQGDVLDLVFRAGPMAQVILFVLAGFSIISWAIMVERFRVISRSEKESRVFLSKFRSGTSLSDLRDLAEKLPHSPACAVFRAGIRQLNILGNPKVASEGGTGPKRDPMTSLERVLVRAVNEEQGRYERLLPFLATTASASPFIGLFGTVWGIMTSFQAIGGMGTANLAVVAPGISEALIATAAGLAAAIPAVIGYNYFVHRIRAVGSRLDNFVADFLIRIEGSLYS
ncbi:MAG TPA: MotA/TolQ/ExbB proton channel family protein [Candidatus Saccharimonadales bacterium]|nr:MotA/TolQ/ExbB proton channel family protein [Candidatus Saccharimonadales bacterium]